MEKYDIELLHKIIRCFPFQEYKSKKYCLFPDTLNLKGIRRQLIHIDKQFQISNVNDCLVILNKHSKINGYKLINIKNKDDNNFYHHCRLSNQFLYKEVLFPITIYFD
jgi:hypothetical protein